MAATIVNGAFRSQRITGQQRYASEIADRLAAREDFTELRPDGRWQGSRAAEWAWTLARLPLLADKAPLLSLTARAPVVRSQVLVVHDLFVLTNPEWFSRGYIATHTPLLRAQLRAAAGVIAVSEPVAEQVAGMYRGPVAVAPNAPSQVFAVSDSSADAAVLKKRGLEPGSYLLTVGSHDPRKNLRALARAYSQIPQGLRRAHPLVVVGGGSSVFRDHDVEWPDETVATGYVSDDELRALYAGARAVVFPSLAEGFGLPLVEAAAAGAQVLVVSDIPVFRWICGEDAVYVDAGSPKSIAQGLSLAILDDLTRPSISTDRFNWEASAAVVADFCAATMGGAH
ncbi:glycosyltransferase family 4 protein [Micropruina sp.]|uniref:glycosyltransferase family 4 protein n=1 Tax=Micropruina sp. TaxID=2737536 RepID=UPI0039E3E7E8